MSDKIYLIDSNIIIYHLQGDTIAMDFLKEYISKSCISILTFIEVLSYDFSTQERIKVEKLLRKFNIINTSLEIAVQALENRKTKKIKIADNIIASTAQMANLTLVTRNVRDFNNLSIKIFNPYNHENRQ